MHIFQQRKVVSSSGTFFLWDKISYDNRVSSHNMLYGWISFSNLKSVQCSLNYVKVLMGVAFKILYSVRMY